MASRSLFRKFSDGLSRSPSLLGTLSARDATVHGTLGNVFHGSAVHLPGMTVLSNRGIHRYATNYFKQTFSSSASKQAEMATKQAQAAADYPEIRSRQIAERQVDAAIALLAFGSIGWLYILSDHDDARSKKGSVCNCQCHCSNVKQD